MLLCSIAAVFVLYLRIVSQCLDVTFFCHHCPYTPPPHLQPIHTHPKQGSKFTAGASVNSELYICISFMSDLIRVALELISYVSVKAVQTCIQAIYLSYSEKFQVFVSKKLQDPTELLFLCVWIGFKIKKLLRFPLQAKNIKV